ncbi:MAG: hypothetical protein ACREIC_07260 [Limisphaerales bacterium]
MNIEQVAALLPSNPAKNLSHARRGREKPVLLVNMVAKAVIAASF